MLALLNAGLSMAGDYTETNQMPEQIHALMETEGYAIDQQTLSVTPQNTNSLRNLKVVENGQFMLLELPAKKAGWSLWNNSSIKHLARNADTINGPGPTPLSQFEYDVTYSFHF